MSGVYIESIQNTLKEKKNFLFLYTEKVTEVILSLIDTLFPIIS